MSMTVVVTGGNGFVGRYLIRELDQSGEVLAIHSWDRTQPTNPRELPATTDLVDITNPGTYLTKLQEIQPTWLIHLAAVSSVEQSWRDPVLTQRINVDATRELLSAIDRASPATKVVVVSTADIYGQGSATPLPELPLPEAHPQSPYAKSKWEMEKMIEASFNHRVIRVRPFPHLGPGQARGFVSADFASQIAAIEAGQQPPVIRVGNLSATRDFTDVRDVVRAYRLLLQQGEVGTVYHVASGQGTSVQTLLDELLHLSTKQITIEADPARHRPSDITALVGDATKLRSRTGWQPEIPLSQSLTDILRAWRQATTA